MPFDAASQGQLGSPGPSLVFSHTVANQPNRALLVQTADEAIGNAVSGVTYAGVALTHIGTAVQNSNNGYVFNLWYLTAPAVGTHNIIVSSGASGALIIASAASYYGVRQTGQPEASAQGTTSALTVTMVGPMLVVIASGVNVTFPGADANTTARLSTGQGQLIGDNTASKSATLGVSGGSAWAAHIVALRPSFTGGQMFAVF